MRYMDKPLITLLAVIGIVIAVAYAALVGVGYRFADLYQQSVHKDSTFSVNGEGKVTATPDVAEFSFSIINQGGTNIGQTQQANTTAMNDALSFLKSDGVDAKDITTTAYSIDPRYQYYDCQAGGICPPATITGYTVTQTASVKIRDFSKIGEILSGIVQKGANSVTQLTFTIDNPQKLQEQARDEAITQARAQAQDLARAAGVTLGPLVNIQETSPQPITPIYNMAAAAPKALGGSAPTPTVEAGSQNITEDVTLTYQIQ